MISHRRLVPVLVALLAAKGLTGDSLDPWRAWVTFKEFVRRVDVLPDPGVSVQLSTGDGGEYHLVLLRQAVVETDTASIPVGGAVCELIFPLQRGVPHAREFWTFDYATFERFVDVVERDPVFADLLVRTPKRTKVYWENC